MLYHTTMEMPFAVLKTRQRAYIAATGTPLSDRVPVQYKKAKKAATE